jgi:hypothetical protein
MSDSLKRKRPEDARKINVSQEWELEYWSKGLGVSKEELKRVVKAQGPSVAVVKAHFRLAKLRGPRAT